MQVSHPGADDRCQHVDRSKQCSQEAIPGFDRCRAHMPAAQLQQEDQRQYLISKVEYRTRHAHFAEHEHVKSLRDEIALARVLVERRFNLIHDDAALIASCAPINQLLLTIERLVKTCHTMEQSLGSLLARETVLQLGRKICEVIVDELQGLPDYEQRIDALIERLIPTLTETKNVQEIQTLQR